MVLKWDAQPPKPSLFVECPPKQIFTPIRIHLTLSWAKPADMPHDYQKTLVELNTLTKLKTTRSGLTVRLRLNKKGEEKWEEKWVTFNDIIGLDLQGQ